MLAISTYESRLVLLGSLPPPWHRACYLPRNLFKRGSDMKDEIALRAVKNTRKEAAVGTTVEKLPDGRHILHGDRDGGSPESKLHW